MKNMLVTLLLLLCLSGCEETFFEPEPANNPSAVFEQFIKDMDAYYALFEERGIAWEQLKATYTPQSRTLHSEEELYRLLTKLMAEFDDGHLQLTAPGKEVFYANRVYREKLQYDLFDEHVIKANYLQAGTVEEDSDKGYMYGKINDGILYCHTDFVDEQWETLGEWIKRHADSQGIILDLRHNSGGDFTYALQLAEELANKRQLVFSSKTKNGPAPNQFTPWHDWYLHPRGEGYAKKIIVLTDAFTMSAAERATMALAALPNTVLVGEKTNGSTSTMIARELQNGWYYSLSTQQVRFADRKSYEGKGFPVDVYVQNQASELAEGKDAVLEKAIELLKP